MDKTLISINSYNKNAKNYAKKFMNFEDYRNIIIEFSKYINDEDNILDLACGPGNTIKCIRENIENVKITGIDLSEKMLEIAKETNPKDIFIKQDLRELEISNKYDVIIMSFCIVHLFEEEAKELLKKVSNILKENGKLYLSFMEGKKSGYEKTSFSNEEIFFNYFSKLEIEKELKKLNIKILKSIEQEYKETDGSITKDIFIFGEKGEKNVENFNSVL